MFTRPAFFYIDIPLYIPFFFFQPRPAHTAHHGFFLLAFVFFLQPATNTTRGAIRRSGFKQQRPMPTHHPLPPCTNTTPSRVAPPLPQPTIPDNHQPGAAAAPAPGLSPMDILIRTHTLSLSLHIPPTCLLLDLIDYSPFYSSRCVGGLLPRLGLAVDWLFGFGFGRWGICWWYGAGRFLFLFLLFFCHREEGGFRVVMTATSAGEVQAWKWGWAETG